MYKPTIALLLLFACSSALWAQVPPPPKDAAKSDATPQLVVAKRKIDLGKVLEGDKASLTWRLENKGAADLVITETRASCGCTLIKLSDADKLIRPGAYLDLQADFDSSRRFGAQTKLITVESNDPAEPKLQLEFVAEVERTYDLSPSTLNLRTVRRGVPTERVLTITPESGRKSVEILDISYHEAAPLTYKTEPIKTQSGGTGQKITFTVSEEAALGNLIADAVIKLRVDGLERTTELPIRGEIVADLTWIPKVIDATRQPSPRGQQLQTVTVTSTESTPFEITSATAGPWLDVKINQEKTSTPKYTVQLTIKEDAPAGPFAAALEIKTTLVDQPVVTVPVFGIVAPRVDIDPPLILFRQDGPPAGTQRRVKLQTPPQVELDIQRLSCDLDALSVEVDKTSLSRYKHLRYLNVRLNGKLPKGTHETTLHVGTNVPGAGNVDIPVTIVVPG